MQSSFGDLPTSLVKCLKKDPAQLTDFRARGTVAAGKSGESCAGGGFGATSMGRTAGCGGNNNSGLRWAATVSYGIAGMSYTISKIWSVLTSGSAIEGVNAGFRSSKEVGLEL